MNSLDKIKLETMKKFILVFISVLSLSIASAQIARPNIDGKVSEFTKMVTSYTNGQRVDVGRLAGLYTELNCTLIESQAEALDNGLQETREESCGDAKFPTTQSMSDATFKRYADQVAKYIDYKKKNGK